MSDTTTREVLDGIFAGNCDDDLDEIIQFVKNRKQTLGRGLLRSLRAGDEVQFSDAIRPKYLIGLTATFVKRNRTTITVDCPDDPAYGRFQNSQGVRCPLELIEGAG